MGQLKHAGAAGAFSSLSHVCASNQAGPGEVWGISHLYNSSVKCLKSRNPTATLPFTGSSSSIPFLKHKKKDRKLQMFSLVNRSNKALSITNAAAQKRLDCLFLHQTCVCVCIYTYAYIRGCMHAYAFMPMYFFDCLLDCLFMQTLDIFMCVRETHTCISVRVHMCGPMLKVEDSGASPYAHPSTQQEVPCAHKGRAIKRPHLSRKRHVPTRGTPSSARTSAARYACSLQRSVVPGHPCRHPGLRA